MSKARIIHELHDDFGVSINEAEKAYNIALEYIRLRSCGMGDRPENYKPSEYVLVKSSAKSDSDAEFWENRATEYSKIIASLVADMSKGINFESMQITETGKIIFGRAEQEVIHCGDCKYKDDGIDEYGIPFLKCLNGRSYGGTKINDYCSWAERRNDETD